MGTRVSSVYVCNKPSYLVLTSKNFDYNNFVFHGGERLNKLIRSPPIPGVHGASVHMGVRVRVTDTQLLTYLKNPFS